jgi:flagellar motility protein MotE (MotC chaperone)
MESLKTTLSELLAQYNEGETNKIKSLVRIYENMKPKDALELFNTLKNEKK